MLRVHTVATRSLSPDCTYKYSSTASDNSRDRRLAMLSLSNRTRPRFFSRFLCVSTFGSLSCPAACLRPSIAISRRFRCKGATVLYRGLSRRPLLCKLSTLPPKSWTNRPMFCVGDRSCSVSAFKSIGSAGSHGTFVLLLLDSVSSLSAAAYTTAEHPLARGGPMFRVSRPSSSSRRFSISCSPALVWNLDTAF